MSGSIVNVLTPNGRRQNIKVQPNTALLKVLEEVCEKHKFDPNEHDLKHHKRILDLTTSFRFSGLPNNAQLEMVDAQKKRTDVDVELVVQLSDGTRLQGKFKPNITILSIIQQLCPNELSDDDLVAIYMRTEVISDDMANTTLKDLGLISGRAIVRLIHRAANAAKFQANVALNLQPKISETKDETKESGTSASVMATVAEAQIRENKMRKTDDESERNASFAPIQNEKMELTAQNMNVEMKSTEDSSKQKRLDESASGSEMAHEQLGEARQEEKMDVCSSEQANELMIDGDEDSDIGEIHILGDRNAVLFTQDAAKAANLSDLPDSFFDLSVNDLKLLIKELRTKAEGSVEQPLMTAKLREMEEEQKQLSLLNRYKTVIIRIHFPNRLVLQGTFTPYDTIDTVISFVRVYLANADIDFYLYTTPPKTILSKELRLFEANCVPSAILHFGSDEKQINYLKEDILHQISSPKASLMQALSDRGIKQAAEAFGNAPSNENNPSTAAPRSRSSNVASNPSTGARSSTSADDVKLPKWFKPFGK